MNRIKTLYLAIAAAMLMMLASCAISSPSLPSSTPSPSQTGAVSYGTVVQLRDAAIAAGYDCPNWTQENQVDLAAESGTCSDADVFSTFTDANDLNAMVTTLKTSAGPVVGISLLVGPNWVINTDIKLDLLQTHLGGTIVRVDPDEDE